MGHGRDLVFPAAAVAKAWFGLPKRPIASLSIYNLHRRFVLARREAKNTQFADLRCAA